MAQKTALDLINEVEERLGYSVSSTIEGNDLRGDTRKLKRLLNRVVKTLQSLREWPLLRSEGEIVTLASYTAGTASVVQNSSTVAGTGTVWDASFKSRAFQVDGDEYVYRIASIETPTSLTLNRAYLGTTNATASYLMAQDRYSLPDDFDAPIDDFNSFFIPSGVSHQGHKTFAARRRARGSSILLGEPSMFTLDGLDEQAIRRVVRFDPFPEFQRMYTFSYSRNHPDLDKDDDRLLFTARTEDAIIETMIDLAYRDFDDDDRMQHTLRDMLASHNAVGVAKEITEEPMRVTLSNSRRLREKQRFGGSGYDVDYGAWFDIVGFNNLS